MNVDNRNQLTTASRSGTLTVAGTTMATANNVTVNGLAATRYGDNTFAKDGFSPVDGTNTFTAVASDALGRSDTTTNSAFLPATVSFVYDANGNLTSDGRRGFDYDDENQLIRVTVTNTWKSEFVYDGGQRRRVRKEFLWVNSAWVQTNEIRYVYDGNLAIQERDGNNVPQVSYVRGLDLGGGIQTAGGIGGLLARHDHAAQATAYYHADGGGNVTALINQKAAIVAQYLYDAFGNLIALKGELAEANLYRFSSKELHSSSGLIYFGHRFYDPTIQRWLNQDPLEEQGGLNLHAFVGNDSANRIDPSGLIWKVIRLRSPRGLAYSDDPSDTFEGLAKVMNMDVSDYQTWAQTTDEKPPIWKGYSVPNTILIHYGFDSTSANVFKTFRELARLRHEEYDNAGFLVKEADVNSNAIRTLLKSPDLFGYIFIGHGDDDFGTGAINLSKSRSAEGVIPDRYTQFGIAFMELHACSSLVYKYKNARAAAYQSTAWELNVSTRGYLLGYNTGVNQFNVCGGLGVVRGANAQMIPRPPKPFLLLHGPATAIPNPSVRPSQPPQ